MKTIILHWILIKMGAFTIMALACTPIALLACPREFMFGWNNAIQKFITELYEGDHITDDERDELEELNNQ